MTEKPDTEDEKTPEAPTIDQDQIVMEPRDALEFLGKVIQGRSLLEAYVAATTIKVKKPSKSVSTEYEQPKDE
jgi:hypothetical protein